MGGLHEFTQLRPSRIINDLLQLIDTCLPGFTSSDEFIRILEQKKNENQHSLSFCAYMTNRCASKFYFGRENPQLGSSVVDIGIYFGGNLIFTIEAKLLPTPKSTKRKPRQEHEYVYGDGAGIQRFREEKHGLDNAGNLLPESGMIAFVKEENHAYWHNKVNEWIVAAQWPDTEMLTGITSEPITMLSSTHVRKGKSKIVLYHYWIKVS